MRGDHRLEVKDEVTEFFRDYDESKTPGCRIKFLTSKKHSTDYGEWVEYKVLYKIKKYKDTADYLSYVFDCMSKAIKELSVLNVDSIGIQEVENSDPYSYYVLIYLLSNGRENRVEEEFTTDEYDEV